MSQISGGAWSIPPPPGTESTDDDSSSFIKDYQINSSLNVSSDTNRKSRHAKSRSPRPSRDDRHRDSHSRHKYRRRSRSRSRSSRKRSRTHRRSRSRSRSRHYSPKRHHKSSRNKSPSRSRVRRHRRRSYRSRSWSSHSRDSDTNVNFSEKQKQKFSVDESEEEEEAPVKENVFKNDGSFLEMFKKMQEQKAVEEQSKSTDVSENIEKTLVPPVFSKRRGGRVLKTGMVQKQRAINENDISEPQDAWTVYMKEVKRYKEACCDDDSKTRPLVK